VILLNQVNDLCARVASLEHAVGCTMALRNGLRPPCTCGLSEALASAMRTRIAARGLEKLTTLVAEMREVLGC